MGKQEKVIYYDDELNNEFSKSNIKTRTIDENYVYTKKGFFNRLIRFVVYKIILKPIAVIYCKLRFSNKIVNKKALKPYKKQGIFLYGNHTQQIFDVFLPAVVSGSKYISVIVHPDNVSMKFLGKTMEIAGALPLPGNIKASRNFIAAVQDRLRSNNTVVIYPEAHIWPFYTKIRPFKSTSFKYPIEMDVPVFCFTNTYQKRKFGKFPKIVTYVDGPFFPNRDLPKKDMQEDLRRQVYNAMEERSKNSNLEYIKYVYNKKDLEEKYD